jgi:cysteine-rich repeat protein
MCVVKDQAFRRVMKQVGFAALLLGSASCSEEHGSDQAGRDVQDIGSVQSALCVEQKLAVSAASASSTQNAQFPASLAVDGVTTTRWSSAFADPQWIQLDLGARRQISRVVLNWEAAASKSYTLGLSDSATGPFTTIYSDANGNGGIDNITGLNAQGRYLRMTSTARTTAYGVSLYEFEAYGDPSAACGSAVCGNGVVEAGEQCDDGNLVGTDACTSTCRNAVCGDGLVRSGVEPCDDGNTASGDGCSATCTVEQPTGCVEQALQRTAAVASSIENAMMPASLAIDGSATTRWSSAFADPQWIYVDLGASRHVSRVNLSWEAAASKSYQVQIASDPNGTWSTLYTDTNGNGGVDNITGLNGTGRYVRMYSSARTTAYGNSLFDFAVLGDNNPNCGANGPRCGNGVLESGEACDDGNTNSGDGCSATCAVEATGCGSVKLTPTAATASSTASADFPASEAVDGVVQTGCNAANRWASAASDPQWLQVDLGALRHISRVTLRWECSASANYDVQVASNANGPWATVASDPAGNGGVDDLTGLNATGRFVRVYSYARTTSSGASLYEVEVYGDANAACGASACVNGGTNTTSLVVKPGIGARASTTTLSNAVRVAQNPRTKKVYVLTVDGSLRELNLSTLDSTVVVTGNAITGALPSGTFFSSVQGLAFGPEGNAYLVANKDLGNTNVGLVVKGTFNGSTWAWSLLAQTAAYPDSNTPFDHHYNGVAVSPDGQFVFVASGSRTDHGEVQSVNGAFPNTREVPLTASLFRFATNSSNLSLPNTDPGVAPYLWAKGLRNSFDPAFAPDGNLFSGDNGPDSDYNEELNWIRQGLHYGFPWRLGNDDNAMQFPSYNPATDTRLRPGYFGIDNGFYYNDPAFPAKPAGLTDPIASRGPDADLYRNTSTGGITEASAVAGKISTFTGHRSPLGLSFDVAGRLCGDYKRQAFMLSFGAAVEQNGTNGMFPDPGRDLLAIKVIPVGSTFEIETRQIITGFTQPIDSLLLGGKLYVVEYGAAGRIYEIALPVSG